MSPSCCSCGCLSPQEERIAGKNINRKGHERAFAILDTVQYAIPHIDIERARYFTESMRQTEGELLTLRWAKALKNIAEKITVYISPKQLLAGRAGQLGRYAILYPELDGDFYPEALGSINSRENNKFIISQEDVDICVNEIAPYWKGKTFHEHFNASLPRDVRNLIYADERGLTSKFIVNETASLRSGLQWVPDYKKAITRGFLNLRKEAQDKLNSLDTTSSTILWEQKPFLEAMIIVCDAVMIWGKRHADLARSMAAEEKDSIRKAELREIAAICDQVPAYPARTFREAVQCQWFIQMFCRLEQRTGGVISNGRMDQYLFPYYEKDVAEGRLTPEEAKELLECMWVEMSQYMDFNISPAGTAVYEGYAHWEAVTIGGQTPEGEDASNELSYLFLESKREFPLNYPDLAARIHSRTPERFLYEVALTIKDGSGYPKLINDEEAIFRNALKGIPLREAYDYAVSGCTETRHPNRDTYTSGCAYVNFAAALEMTLYNGRMLKYGSEQIGPETGDPETFAKWDEFYSAYKTQHLNLLRAALQQQVIVDKLRPQHFASPFCSCLH
ncbi:MAG: pyruvate formate lyase family protein, partial [Mailhella sp.]